MIKSPINRAAKKINDAQGRKKTLSHGVYSFVKLPINTPHQIESKEKKDFIQGNQKQIVFLGLGYNALPDAINIYKNAINIHKETDKIYYIECEDFEKACAEANIPLIQPNNFIKLTESELFNLLNNPEFFHNEWEFFLYKQNLSLFPRYWNNLLIQLERNFIQEDDKNQIDKILENTIDNKNPSLKTPSIFVAGSSQDLMHKEICHAVKHLGYECITNYQPITNKNSETKVFFNNISSILKEKRPFLFLSVNGRNLDSSGRVFYLLKQLNIPIALWIADNPWNILSGFKHDWWKECHIYITDDSFIPAIKALGANNVYHLPLAAASITERHPSTQPINIPSIPLLYVGHSSFKNKEKFFSAVDKNSEVLSLYKNLVDKYFTDNDLTNKYSEFNNIAGKIPLINFHHIYDLFYPAQKKPLWPNNDFRTISHLTSEIDSYHKMYWFNTLAQHITIIGDSGWKTLVKENIKLLPPVDYYTQLPHYYANAKFTLNIASLLMPNALTQRHFDVWVAGGFLISSPSYGMNIFNTDVTNLITAKTPQMALSLTEKYTTKIKLYDEIKSHMNETIRSHHSYLHRLRIIIDNI